ncbi:MAG: hypothetical protein HRU19_16445 [Pseudobacteriovorax sp.]|nr:hypothetical protein [Pseudobacteriovorax sp.]
MKNLTMSSLIVLGLATGIVGCDKDEKEKIVQVENQETVKQLEETRKELEAEQAKSLSLTGERDKAETEKKAAEDIKVQLENDKTELEAQLKEVEKQLDDAKAAGNDEDRVKELEDEAKDLNTQIADLEDAIAAKDEEITALNKTIDDVNAKLEASEQASVDLAQLIIENIDGLAQQKAAFDLVKFMAANQITDFAVAAEEIQAIQADRLAKEIIANAEEDVEIKKEILSEALEAEAAAKGRVDLLALEVNSILEGLDREAEEDKPLVAAIDAYLAGQTKLNEIISTIGGLTNDLGAPSVASSEQVEAVEATGLYLVLETAQATLDTNTAKRDEARNKLDELLATTDATAEDIAAAREAVRSFVIQVRANTASRDEAQAAVATQIGDIAVQEKAKTTATAELEGLSKAYEELLGVEATESAEAYAAAQEVREVAETNLSTANDLVASELAEDANLQSISELATSLVPTEETVGSEG